MLSELSLFFFVICNVCSVLGFVRESCICYHFGGMKITWVMIGPFIKSFKFKMIQNDNINIIFTDM